MNQEEIIALLKHHDELLKENTELVRKLYRAHIRIRTWYVIKFIVVLLLMLGAYWFVKPFIENLMGSYQDILLNIQNIKAGVSAFPDMAGMSTLLSL